MEQIHGIGTQLDWIVLIVYMAAMLLFGSYFAKYNKDTNDFFFGGRRFSWWLIAMSIVATGVSSHSFVKYSAMGFQHGFSSSMAYMNDWFFVPLFMFGWLPIIVYSKIRSIPEYFERRFSPSARFFVTILQLLYLVGYVGIGFLTLGKAIIPLMPQFFTIFGQNIQVTLMGIVIVTAFVTGVYITFGGQTAVIFTDLVQGFMLLLAGFLVFFVGISYVGGFSDFWGLLPQSWKMPLAPFNTPSDFNSVGVFWQDAISGSVGFLFMNMGLLMRFMAAKSVNEGRKAAAVNILFMLPLSAVVVSGAGWIGKTIAEWNPSILSLNTDPDSIFVAVSHILMGPGVFGFVIAAVAAALMSTVSTLINATAAIWVNDVDRPVRIWLKKVNPDVKQDEKRAMRVARVATVLFTLLGVLAVIPFSSFPTVYEAHAKFHSTLTPPLMIAIFFGIFWRKFTPAALIATVVGGSSLMLLGAYYPDALVTPIAHGTPMDPVHPYTYIGALYNLLVCLVIAVTATVFQKQLKKLSNKIRKNPNGNAIMYLFVAVSILIVVLDLLNIGSLPFLFTSTIVMSGLIALTTTYFVKYDPEKQTQGLTIWSVRHAKEMFKGSKLNDRDSEKVKAHWKVKDIDDNTALFSKRDMKKMEAHPGDLVYISDNRKWLGGLKSVHTIYGEPHDEEGIVYITESHLQSGIFTPGKILEAEKEM
ncbi:MAG: sodium:solute symporter family protein [Bacteroidetes bacterium]|nr:sodium:solute symporter family protein [Bacteroidota bacterium]